MMLSLVMVVGLSSSENSEERSVLNRVVGFSSEYNCRALDFFSPT